jgi:hypothetical protein
LWNRIWKKVKVIRGKSKSRNYIIGQVKVHSYPIRSSTLKIHTCQHLYVLLQTIIWAVLKQRTSRTGWVWILRNFHEVSQSRESPEVQILEEIRKAKRAVFLGWEDVVDRAEEGPEGGDGQGFLLEGKRGAEGIVEVVWSEEFCGPDGLKFLLHLLRENTKVFGRGRLEVYCTVPMPQAGFPISSTPFHGS